MRTAHLILSTLMILTLALSGCGPRIPRDVVGQVTWDGDFRTLQANPAEYQNEFVTFGGRIINTENFEDHAEITVLQYPLDHANRPRMDRESEGRFIVVSDSFLDPEVYARGKMLTVAGRVTGSERRSIGNFQYDHPIIEGETWVWEPRTGVSPRFGFGVGIGKTF